jgi:acetyl esterase/lipase
VTLNRRELIARATAALGLTTVAAIAGCSPSSTGARRTTGVTGPTAAEPTATTPTRHHYGSGPSQFGDLYRPTGPRRPGVAVVIHGGFWLAEYDLTLGAPLAADLAARGYLAFNLEYRRVGDGGGWPTTLQDVADGIDLLQTLTSTSTSTGTGHVVAIGHSAGGQLAAWAAGRGKLPPGAPGAAPKVEVTAVVSQAGVLDLARAAIEGVGGSAVTDFVGGTPAGYPQRYAIADPIKQLPVAAPVLCVHSRADQNVPFAQSTAYVAAARAVGGSATLAEVPGDHFSLIDPTSPAWLTVVAALPGLFTA